MQQQLDAIAKATSDAVTSPQTSLSTIAAAGKGVQLLEALARTLGPHTLADLKVITSGDDAARAQVILRDLTEALDVALHTL